jgi:hypothetical protein
LGRSETLPDFRERLFELRFKAAGFRKKKSELEEELRRGNLKEARRIATAIATEESYGLRKLVVGAGLAGFACWLGIKLDSAPPGVAHVLGATPDLFAGRTVEALGELLRPRMRFLSLAVDSANEITNALDRVSSLWQVPKDRDEFVVAFNKLRQLTY